MEDDELRRTKDMTKNIIKSMPGAWDDHEKFRTELTLFKNDLDCLLKNQANLTKRLSALPELTSQQKPVLPPKPQSQNEDIVKLYKKSGNVYVEESKFYESPSTSLDEIPIDVSAKLLERKVRDGEIVYAMEEPGKPWVKCKVIYVIRKPVKMHNHDISFITFRLRTCLPDSEAYSLDVNKYSVARCQDHGVSLKVSKRVIAGLTKSRMFPGIIGQEPIEINKFRYMVFMDDGSCSYFKPSQVYPILWQSASPWKDQRWLESENIENEAHLRAYFANYPRRHFLFLESGQDLKLFRNGNLVNGKIISIDCDTMRVLYKDDTEESIYRGSPRLIVSNHERARQVASINLELNHLHTSLVLAINLYYKTGVRALDEDFNCLVNGFKKKFLISTDHNKAKKSTTRKQPIRSKIRLEDIPVEENSYSLNNIELWEDREESRSHRCSPDCLDIEGIKTEISVVDITDEYRNVSDLKVPLLLGWKRKLVKKVHLVKSRSKFIHVIIYKAPCGKTFQKAYDIRRYITYTNSKLDVDYFTFERDVSLNNTHEFEKIYYKSNIAVDKKTGKSLENKYISLLNTQDMERLPIDFEYNNVVVPHNELKKRGFSFNTEFKSGCDCEEDCYQRVNCPCHKLNEISAGGRAINRGCVDSSNQYKDKRLVYQVNTGIFECNSFCKCSSKCSNRVVQNGIRYRLQVTKMPGKKGWGVQTLDDIPRGAFICTYAAELLDDADQYGNSDMYYADLDYITINEEAKEGNLDEDEDEGIETTSDSDIGDDLENKKRRRKKVSSAESGDSSSISSLEERKSYEPQTDKSQQQTRYPKRNSRQQASNQNVAEQPVERVKYKRLHTLLKSRDYTLDARMQGNIGRFFNHSCFPNAFVQNVFIETHDLRFPVVAFFALKTIKATSEISWNYNYKMGSIEGRRIDCECGAANCKGRIL